jgi:hypothetical protein
VTYDLVVKEVRPEPSVTLINTDMTVDLMMSEEAEAQVQAKQEEDQRLQRQAEEAVEQAKKLAAHAEMKAASLPAEPPAEQEGVVKVQIRMPMGNPLQRRFLRSDAMQVLYDYVEASGAPSTGPGHYRFR